MHQDVDFCRQAATPEALRNGLKLSKTAKMIVPRRLALTEIDAREHGMGRRRPNIIAVEPLGITKPDFDFSFCESTFEVVSTQGAPNLTVKSVRVRSIRYFLFSINDPRAFQNVN